ncbi:hypothetical protein [Marinimicrobium sp. C2-29]|uniref:hypothetical protein n=1 Tax=Marinimicrobium sp. C2-29 TaxID=3139825 RepID=UPI0031387EA9
MAPVWLAAPAHADSVSTLISRLDQLEGDQVVKVRVDSELWRADGKGDDREEFEVAVEMTAQSGPEGYQLHYGKPLLERLESESESLVENPDAITKTSDFMWQLDLNEIRPLLDTARTLRREVQRSEFRSSQEDTYNDQPATRLTFERDKQVVDGRMRKYVKQFDSSLEIWVDDEGTPLASRMNMHAKGSLLFVIRGEYREEATHHYDTVNDRLIIRQLERWRKADLPGEHRETRLSQRLTPLTAR